MNIAIVHRVSELLIDPKVTPNTDGLPGMDAARKIVGALLTFGLIGAVAGVAVSALVCALSAHNGNSHYASRGKDGGGDRGRGGDVDRWCGHDRRVLPERRRLDLSAGPSCVTG